MTLTVIPEMWELMERSFSGEDPPFDLVGVDDLLLIQAARAGHVEPLDDLIAGDDYSLDDFTSQALAAVSDGGHVWGLPYCDVSNVLIYRADLFDKHGIAVPETLDELTDGGRRDPGGGAGRRNRRLLRNRDPRRAELRPQLLDGRLDLGPLLRRALVRRRRTADARHAGAPRRRRALRRPDPACGPARVADAWTSWTAWPATASGRAAMTIEPANEASIIYDEGGPVADGTKTALVPAGPLGTRHAGLYCPPYAIPSRSQSKEPAWDLARFLCAPEQVLEDAQNSGFVEVSRNSVLEDPAFMSRFRPDLVETTVATRAFARGERPVTRFGMEVGDIIGDEIVRVLTGELTRRRRCAVAEAAGRRHSARPS